MTTNGHNLDIAQLAAKNGHRAPEPTDAHTCPHCYGPIVECEYKALLDTRRSAREMILQANRAEAKLMGAQWGRRAAKEFTREEAVAMVQKLGNISRAAKALGVNWQTVKDRIDPPLRVKAQMKLPPGVTLTHRP